MQRAHASHSRKLRAYDTRLDRFRVEYDIDVVVWAKTAHMSRTHFNKHRSGVDARSDTVAALVQSASVILNRPVRASELYDLGEDVPVAPVVQHPPRATLAQLVRESIFDSVTPFAALLQKLRWGVRSLSRRVHVSKVTLLAIKSGRQKPKVSTIRAIVIRLRAMGYPVIASDIAYLGEETGSEPC